MSYRLLTLGAAVAVAVTSVACSSTQYIISTKEGRMLEAHGKPSLDEKTGVYTYKNSEGKAVVIRKEDVAQILER
jgi:hypothetical protein